MGKVVCPFYLGLVVVVLATFVVRDLVVGVTLEDKMKDDPDLSQYYELIESSKLARVILQLKPVTIFAPMNSAFQKFNLNNAADKEAVLLYHITSIVQTIQQFGSSNIYLSSESIGNSPIWITHVINTTQDDIYVNNARLLIDQSNIVVNNENLRQVLHKIDEVLMPTISTSPAPNVIYNPTAWEFLENFESFMNGLNYRVRIFRQKVQANNKQDIFNLLGSHTFFIPVDEGFNDNKMRLIDSKVIDGHVIPKHVLFTRPTKKDFPFETLASTDNMKVVVSFNEEQEGPARKTEYVKSHTLFGTGTHAPGVVLAEIVKANIPVKNGVIHLIQKPLMVVDSNVKQLLEEKNGHILSRFFEVLKDQGQRGEAILKILETTQEITLLAPSNNALQGDKTLDTIMNNKQHFFDILKMHIVVDDRLYVEKILREQRNSKNGVFFRAPSYNPGKPLYFNVLATEHNRSLTVEGGGVNASVIQADLAATNGIIHIIDRVLGVPHATVLEKIQSDPLLQITYSLGNIRGFNEQLSDVTKRFTYFVPSDRAWKNSKIDIQKLYRGEYTKQATATLERHLVISDEEYTMERIKQLSEDTHTYGTFGQKREVEMQTRTEPLKLYVEQMPDNTFNLIWKGQRIPVLRANVECINGIIHIIDVPFVQEGDIPIYNVNSVSVISLSPQLITLLLVKYLLL